MVKSDDEYINYWKSLNTNEKLNFIDYVENKYNEYREKGFVIYSFRSSTHVVDNNDNTIYSSKLPIVHFIKVFDVVDEYILNNKM